MPTRSWMAALTLAALLPLGARSARAEAAPVENQVTLDLQVVGLTGGDLEVEVKPGHPGCHFPTVVRRVTMPPGRIVRGSDPMAIPSIPIVVRSINPDRECAFAITIREEGQPPRTYRRGVRLVAQAEGQPLPTRSMTCYLSAPPMIARDDKAPPRR